VTANAPNGLGGQAGASHSHPIPSEGGRSYKSRYPCKPMQITQSWYAEHQTHGVPSTRAMAKHITQRHPPLIHGTKSQRRLGLPECKWPPDSAHGSLQRRVGNLRGAFVFEVSSRHGSNEKCLVTQVSSGEGAEQDVCVPNRTTGLVDSCTNSNFQRSVTNSSHSPFPLPAPSTALEHICVSAYCSKCKNCAVCEFVEVCGALVCGASTR
jgi:hypothetical protein